jgi:hypothetical protein
VALLSQFAPGPAGSVVGQQLQYQLFIQPEAYLAN